MRIFTNKERKTFEYICSLRQKEMLHFLKKFLETKYTNVISTSSYIVATGDIPVGLVAHADTVFSIPPKCFYYDQQANVFWSPDGLGADDRAGIFAILKIISDGWRPHIIITTDEEAGGVGASKLIADMPLFVDKLNFLIQLDRRNHNDAVYYDLNSNDFEDFISQFGFSTAFGTFSDISVLAPAWGVAAVNISVGYKDEHSYAEHLHISSLFSAIHRVERILQHVKDNVDYTYFEYVARVFHNYTYLDDGYKLLPLDAQGVSCQFCGVVDLPEMFIPLLWHSIPDLNHAKELEFYVCNECYSKYLKSIEWCSNCNNGYFLASNEVTALEKNSSKDWKCKHCQEGQK